MRIEMRARGLESHFGAEEKIAEMLTGTQFARSFPENAINQMYRRYKEINVEQEQIMTGNSYVELGGDSLRRLKNVRTAIICGGDGSIPANMFSAGELHEKGVEGWLQRRLVQFPITTRRPLRDEINGDDRTNLFTELVFRLLTVAQPPLTTLVPLP